MMRSIAPDIKRNTAPIARLARADARRNRARLLEVAREVYFEDGADASLREIARRAGVGVGTLYRHFPTRETLIEELVRHSFDDLAARADQLISEQAPFDALACWLGEVAAGAAAIRGLPESIMANVTNPDSPLHGSCTAMRAAGARLLHRAQQAGAARADIDSTGLFTLVGALGWISEHTTPDKQRILINVVITGLASPPA